MSRRAPDFSRIVTTRPSVSDPGGAYRAPADDDGLRGPEIDAVIEIAFAMANADGDASYDEVSALSALVKYLEPGKSVRERLESLGDALEDAGSVADFARAAAEKLTRTSAREMAYKVACAVAVFDLETNEEERDLDDVLVSALAIGDRVGDLELEVSSALSAE